MKSRRRNLSEEVPQTISRHSSRVLNADEESWSEIPIEVVIEIFSRLPLQSIARCRCVSKRWASILRRQDFTDLFFTRSLARPQLLIAFQRDHRRLLFLSSPQSRENGSLIIAADHHLSFGRVDRCQIFSIVNGLFCIRHDRSMNRRSKTRERVLVICNPSTRQSFTLPKMKTTKRTRFTGFLGYDPIEKQHKVLAMTNQDDRGEEHQVLTLGTRNMTWRMAECGIPHSFPRGEGLCINGVLYYTAVSNSVQMLVCFDVRSEKYSFVKSPEGGSV
ncbi:unnamed protein product [Brassica oleracea var. botrytis]